MLGGVKVMVYAASFVGFAAIWRLNFMRIAAIHPAGTLSRMRQLLTVAWLVPNIRANALTPPAAVIAISSVFISSIALLSRTCCALSTRLN